MSAENQPSEPENQNEQSDSIDKPKKAFVLTDEARRRMAESEKEHRRYKRREKRFEFSWISWFCDEFPNEEVNRPALAERRNTRQEMAYHRFRQMTSWSFWSRMKSGAGIKLAAVGGLVAAFLQAAPSLKGAEAAVGPLSWLLVGGGFYLLAVIWFEWKCPVLLKRTLAGKDEYLGIEGRRWLLALVEDELRRWWSVKHYELDVGRIKPESNKYQLALAITQHGDIPAYGGFGEFASARIEYALHEYAQLTSTTIWREDSKPNEFQEFMPGHRICPLNTPLRNIHLSVMNGSEVKMAKVGKEGDLVVRWFDGSLDFHSELPTHRNLMVSAYAEGLIYLFRTDASALTFTRIIAQWQNTMRPLSRFVLISLFLASGGCFVWFVFLQLKILLPGLL
ncbi:hypothetical protein Q8X48_23420 [Pseudomonas sp. QLc11A]|uniref:DUF3137 domain-containing protein n=1 Tax=Pseudomonas azerbaijanorientalis TaxID=2842350 RepID=A0ABW8W2G2_9PSED